MSPPTRRRSRSSCPARRTPTSARRRLGGPQALPGRHGDPGHHPLPAHEGHHDDDPSVAQPTGVGAQAEDRGLPQPRAREQLQAGHLFPAGDHDRARVPDERRAALEREGPPVLAGADVHTDQGAAVRPRHEQHFRLGAVGHRGFGEQTLEGRRGRPVAVVPDAPLQPDAVDHGRGRGEAVPRDHQARRRQLHVVLDHDRAVRRRQTDHTDLTDLGLRRAAVHDVTPVVPAPHGPRVRGDREAAVHRHGRSQLDSPPFGAGELVDPREGTAGDEQDDAVDGPQHVVRRRRPQLLEQVVQPDAGRGLVGSADHVHRERHSHDRHGGQDQNHDQVPGVPTEPRPLPRWRRRGGGRFPACVLYPRVPRRGGRRPVVLDELDVDHPVVRPPCHGSDSTSGTADAIPRPITTRPRCATPARSPTAPRLSRASRSTPGAARPARS